MREPNSSRESVQSGLAQVVTRAAVDREFRAALLADPHAAIRDALSLDLPSDLRIRFVEKDPDVDLMVVLPDLIAGCDELSVEMIDQVFGGRGALAGYLDLLVHVAGFGAK